MKHHAELELGVPGKSLWMRRSFGRYLCNEEHLHNLTELGKMVLSWKSFTGRKVVKHHAELELGVPGKSFWMLECCGYYIPNEEHHHLQRVIEYIHQYPVKARLCHFLCAWQPEPEEVKHYD